MFKVLGFKGAYIIMNISKINAKIFHNMLINAGNELEEKKEYVNSLNVFPVPDGDTGTNMSLTFKSAVQEIVKYEGNSVGDMAKIFAKGALMGARGNSGVILSQILRGIAKGFENKYEVSTNEFAEAIMEGAKSAYKAVMRPTEGTILTVIRGAGEAAIKSESKDLISLMNEVCEYSKVVLDKTPEILEVLKKANVVDAGGMGLYILLTGMLEGLKCDENQRLTIIENLSENKENSAFNNFNTEDIHYGYCTEFLIRCGNCDVNKFRSELEKMGDSIVAVSYDDIVKVHIHTNEPGEVITKALKLGPAVKLKIENMREQHTELLLNNQKNEEVNENEVVVSSETKAYAFIAVAVGEGIENVFKDLGVEYIVSGGQTMNPSTQDFIKYIDKINAENIYIFPNNKNIIMAASQAAEMSEKNVIVIPTKTVPQGITAITVFNDEYDADKNKQAMVEAIDNVTTATVTYAVKDTEFDGKEIHEGNVLGIRENEITEVGTDIYDVCEKLINSIVTDESELITIFYGEDCNEDEVNNLKEKLESNYEDIDIQVLNGCQPLYYFIISVE
jgi:DAK2 domain fusion protein YloV